MADNQVFMKIEPRSMEDEIFFRMREAIVSGQIKLGNQVLPYEYHISGVTN